MTATVAATTTITTTTDITIVAVDIGSDSFDVISSKNIIHAIAVIQLGSVNV